METPKPNEPGAGRPDPDDPRTWARVCVVDVLPAHAEIPLPLAKKLELLLGTQLSAGLLSDRDRAVVGHLLLQNLDTAFKVDAQ